MSQYRNIVNTLAQLYPTEGDARRILKYSDIDLNNIDLSGSANNRWSNIVDYIEPPRNQLNHLLQVVMDEEDNDQLFEFIREETDFKLLVDASRAYKSEYEIDLASLKEMYRQLVEKGELKEVLDQLRAQAANLSSSDYRNSVASIYAQLNSLIADKRMGVIGDEFYTRRKNQIRASILYLIDQLDSEYEIKEILNKLKGNKVELTSSTGLNVPDKSEFERIMGGRNDIMPIEWLFDAIEQARFVCKVELSNGESGTGFLLKGGYLMTNHHVHCKHFPQHKTRCELECLQTLECAKNARIVLDYQVNKESRFYSLDPEKGYFVSKELDYAVVKVKDDPNYPLTQWGYATFETFVQPKKGELVNIIQHPKGDKKKIAMPDEVIAIWKEKNYLFYTADTQKGSSGSPVFNQEWKVVALHHAGKQAKQGGLEINAAGVRKESNRGILIGAILNDLREKGLNLDDSH